MELWRCHGYGRRVGVCVVKINKRVWIYFCSIVQSISLATTSTAIDPTETPPKATNVSIVGANFPLPATPIIWKSVWDWDALHDRAWEGSWLRGGWVDGGRFADAIWRMLKYFHTLFRYRSFSRCTQHLSLNWWCVEVRPFKNAPPPPSTSNNEKQKKNTKYENVCAISPQLISICCAFLCGRQAGEGGYRNGCVCFGVDWPVRWKPFNSLPATYSSTLPPQLRSINQIPATLKPPPPQI